MPQIGVWHAHGAEIDDLMRQGMSMAEIGRRFGVSRERIRVVLKAHKFVTKAPMLNQKEAAALLGCCSAFLRGLEYKGVISPIHSGLKHGPVYYPEGELKKIRAIMARAGLKSPEKTRGMAQDQRANEKDSCNYY